MISSCLGNMHVMIKAYNGQTRATRKLIMLPCLLQVLSPNTSAVEHLAVGKQTCQLKPPVGIVEKTNMSRTGRSFECIAEFLSLSLSLVRCAHSNMSRILYILIQASCWPALSSNNRSQAILRWTGLLERRILTYPCPLHGAIASLMADESAARERPAAETSCCGQPRRDADVRFTIPILSATQRNKCTCPDNTSNFL